eukprot:TRINITY_DN123015_c0_g1_i1.p1 TRINITY_DN123015_c0_g1~~TRINITY_DN123015_c0_g1_i1.p1  ORF type:complete len:479 (+),score=86.55 TRINITY_DN123015_c0_g1_i1:142-1578(+)
MGQCGACGAASPCLPLRWGSGGHRQRAADASEDAHAHSSSVFFDAEEGDSSADHLFALARLSAHNLASRSSAAVPLAGVGRAIRAVSPSASIRSLSGRLRACRYRRPTPLPSPQSPTRSTSLDEDGSPRPCRQGGCPAATPPAAAPSKPSPMLSWWGQTIPEWTGPGRPPDGSAHWSRGDGRGLRVRCNTKGEKHASQGALYECFSADLVQASCKVGEVMERLVQLPPPCDPDGSLVGGGGSQLSGGCNGHCATSSSSASTYRRWAPGCPLPRVICIVVQLPEQAGPAWGTHPVEDHGCSFVAAFHIKQETLAALEQGDCPSEDVPEGLRLFQEFCKRGQTDLPMPKGKSRTSGLFKFMAVGENIEELGIPWLLASTVKSYNGKPCLVTKSGAVFKDPKCGEWMEIDVDVRLFSALARQSLVSLRHLMPKASIHVGFTIQANEEHEMPEGIVCDMHVHNMNLSDGAYTISDPRSDEDR